MAHGLDHQHFRSYEEVKKWIDSWIVLKDASFFRDRKICTPNIIFYLERKSMMISLPKWRSQHYTNAYN